MTTREKLVERTLTLLRERGKNALEVAKQSILQERIEYKPLQEALRYFMDEFFKDVMHPGLLSIYCEAVGGDPDETTQVGAAMVLLVGAADLHDDIIDQSTTKNGKPTVFGKFGRDVTVLAGDALLIKGVFLLFEATAILPENNKRAILRLITQAFFDLSSAEAEEASLRGKNDLSGREYLEILKRKTAVSEATARIGAILGEGTPSEVGTIGEIGHILGLLNTMRDEFIDVFEPDELSNRAAREILPLPVLNIFQDPKKKDEIFKLLKRRKITRQKTERILDIVMEATETKELKNQMQSLIRKGIYQLSCLRGAKKTLALLLESAVEDLK